jgi:hypothetical protein
VSDVVVIVAVLVVIVGGRCAIRVSVGVSSASPTYRLISLWACPFFMSAVSAWINALFPL